MRPVRISVRISPREVGWTGHWNFSLQEFVVGFQVLVGDGPICADSVFCVHPKIRWMEARSERRPMNGATAHAFAAVIFAQRERIFAAGNPQIVPVEFVRSLFVADPISFRVPERSG